jgi:Peptidase family M23
VSTAETRSVTKACRFCTDPSSSQRGGRGRPYGRRMVAATVLALVLANPVGGDVTAGFDVAANPFRAGQHRGVDLEAAPGEGVRAACSGRVVVAGRVGSSGHLVTVRCGDWRVTHMPMAQISVRAGAVIARGTRLGTVGDSDDHAGLHLGVRREGHRFGYVDPLRFFSSAPLPPPTVRLPTTRRAPPARPTPLPHAEPAPHANPAPGAKPARLPTSPLGSGAAGSARGAPGNGLAPWSTAPLGSGAAAASARGAPGNGLAPWSTAPLASGAAAASARGDAGGGLAPWPAWVGLGLVLAGAGLRIRGRRGRGRGWSVVVLRRPVR